ncbi:hypothetical protein [Mycobacteroides abscessus]|uniref:hypothetical protein n=1 Tax=Mycobacteroides abscessus TaxID=36809 RepID=UPI00092ADAB6|nr:hypothetical protein [Mycobacteroides abscessus]SHX64382.1 Uncharacterised protein [Mycobacteroides abscessus subsp. abscessus]SHZ18616.1 Uncharacterised protein [Mycobacteroides abscessus subsp. abscessus]SIB50656.1 Uncharacterised protein [Mycobacteroides abscessus subsp. abscessus]SIF19150.1 Uncharacterised protein [Mycobacteroides abscessus subsp. abscessus]SKI48510.1 Uncharacterised protein [Mycobacteroides abscessus subsp. abscessus]
MTATDKQVRYALHLLGKNGYSTTWMNARFVNLGATCRERSGKVTDWLKGLDSWRISRVIDQLKSESDAA